MVVRAIALLGALGVAAPVMAQAGGGAGAGAAKKPWTLLVYAAADNNADMPVLEFMGQVRDALDGDAGMDVLMFIDRWEKEGKRTPLLGEGFTGARLYRLHKDSAERLAGGAEMPEITLAADPELNSADAGTLGRFIAWGKRVSPAEKYALLIYSHANGRTMCPDDQCDGHMGIAELTDKIGPEGRVDFLALELCNMGGAEIAYQWRPQAGRFGADVLLAIPNAGPPLDWDRAFANIRSSGHLSAGSRPPLDPAEMTAADFGRLVIEEGLEGRNAAVLRGAGMSHEAAACYDLSKAAEVKEAVDGLARALAETGGKDAFVALRSGDDAAMNYTEGGAYVDLYDLCARATKAEGLSASVREAATEAMRRTDEMVIASFGMAAYEGFEPGKNGVFIVLPPPASWARNAWYTPRKAGGRDYGRWSFLADGATEGNGKVENWFELLDSWGDGNDAGVNGYRP